MYVNKKNIIKSMKTFGKEGPFDHCVIDNFFDEKIAFKLDSEFPNYDSKIWHIYDNYFEIKKTCNNWNIFPKLTYQVFNYLNSGEFVSILSKEVFNGKKLFSDIGLNGGGWHIHKQGGRLNPHLDYSIHPKLRLQRKLNIIIYLNSNWKGHWGGDLSLWDNKSSKKPGELIKSIMPKFNRAILFDTTQNSWHGLSESLKCPKNQYRKSFAVYYLCKPLKNASIFEKALFAPTSSQKNSKEVLELIKKRSLVETAYSVYRK
jgi:hypothetical protein